MALNRMRFMNIDIDNVTMKEAIEYIMDCIEKKEHMYVVTPNVDHIVQLQNNPALLDAYKNSGLVVTDGTPLIWISKLYGTPIREKICGSDLTPLLIEEMWRRDKSIFLLGAMPGVGDMAANELRRRHPGIRIAGIYSPPRGFENDAEEMERVLDVLNASGADALFVGLGAPKQELFMYRNKDKYNIPASLGIGATIDFLAGEIKRAPKWINIIGFEWLYRILQDPKRLIKRYLVDDMKFIKLCLKYRPRTKK